jgi:hypothetical protein
MIRSSIMSKFVKGANSWAGMSCLASIAIITLVNILAPRAMEIDKKSICVPLNKQ